MKITTIGPKLLFLLAAAAAFVIARGITKPRAPTVESSADPIGRMGWDQLMMESQQALKGNDINRAIALCNQALGMASGFDPGDSRYSYSQVLRAEIYLWQKQNENARKMFQQAVDNCAKAQGANSPALVYPLSSEANFYFFVAHQNEKVAPIYARILQIVQQDPKHDPHDPSVWTRNLAKVYQQQRKFADAEPLFEQDIAISAKIDQGWLASELLEQSTFYRAWGKYDLAESTAGRALGIRDKMATALGINADVQDAQLEISRCLNSLGETYLAWGKPDRAEVVYRRSLEISQKYIPPGQADLAVRLIGLADALRAQRKYDPAEPLFRQALDLTEKNLGPDSMDVAEILEKFGAMLNDMHRADEGEKMLSRAAGIRKEIAAARN